MGFQLVDNLFLFIHHLLGYRLEVLVEQVVFLGVRSQLSGHGEQLPLQVPQDVLHLVVVGQGAGQAHQADRLVGDAIRLGVRVGLGNASPVEQAGLALVPRTWYRPACGAVLKMMTCSWLYTPNPNCCA